MQLKLVPFSAVSNLKGVVVPARQAYSHCVFSSGMERSEKATFSQHKAGDAEAYELLHRSLADVALGVMAGFGGLNSSAPAASQATPKTSRSLFRPQYTSQTSRLPSLTDRPDVPDAARNPMCHSECGRPAGLPAGDLSGPPSCALGSSQRS